MLGGATGGEPRTASVNLTLVRAEIAGWAERARGISPEARARLLAEHDAIVLPALAAFGGRRLAASGGAVLAAFGSPTDAVQFAAAAQDLLARRGDVGGGALSLRVAIHQGEVRFARGAPVGPPAALLAAVAEGVPPGEIWLTRGVYLTMSRSEVPLEELGARALAGAPEPVPVYRVARAAGELPYGGRHLARAAERAAPGLLAPLADAVVSIQVAAGSEGRAGATLRVGGALSALGALALLRAGSATAEGIARGAFRLVRGRRPLPPAAARATAALATARAWARARETVHLLRLRRPGGAGGR